jgi:ArsR family transcriptional regulator, arsenate/arsenite/antimonite-responsive transcriptional repressor
MTDTLELTGRKRGARCCDGESVEHLSATQAERLSGDLDTLAHPIRLQILDIIARHPGQVCVCDIESSVSVKQPTVSHHLRLLRAAGLIDCERHGLWAYYVINREALARLRARIVGHLESLG